MKGFSPHERTLTAQTTPKTLIFKRFRTVPVGFINDRNGKLILSDQSLSHTGLVL
jgi:hypothetical protein